MNKEFEAKTIANGEVEARAGYIEQQEGRKIGKNTKSNIVINTATLLEDGIWLLIGTYDIIDGD